jgi:hypothetical protein
MRFALSAALLALVGAASAAVIERQTGGILTCTCFVDNQGSKGTLVGTTKTTYTCAYKGGSCTWDQVCQPQEQKPLVHSGLMFAQVSGTLINSGQPNCFYPTPCV